MKGITKDLKISVENNTQALQQIKEVIVKCRRGDD
jgi:hypothetical protein